MRVLLFLFAPFMIFPVYSAAGQVDVATSLELVYLDDGALQRFDLSRRSAQSLLVPADGPVQDAALSPDGDYLAYMDDGGTLRWVNLLSEETTKFPPFTAPPPGYWPEGLAYTSTVSPHTWGDNAWSHDGRLIIEHWGWESYTLGWTSVADPTWHPLPARPPFPALPEWVNQNREFYGCGATAWSPLRAQFVFAASAPGGPCDFLSGLALVDVERGTAAHIVAQPATVTREEPPQVAGTNDPAWSPDGDWIAFSMQLDAVHHDDGSRAVPWGLFVVRPDGSDLTSIPQTDGVRTIMCVQWATDGSIYFVDRAIDRDDGAPADLFSYHPQTQTLTHLSSFSSGGRGLRCHVAPDSRLMAISERSEISIVSLENLQTIATLESGSDTALRVVGWRAA